MVTLNGNPFTFNDVYARYSSDQAQSIVNECDSSNCGNISPQNQADGNAFAPIVSLSGGGQGEQGPPGPTQELQVRQVVGSPVFVEAGEEGSSTAECAPDEVPTGGGWRAGELFSPLDTNVINPFIDDGRVGNGWTAKYQNPGPEDAAITAVAQCAKLVDSP